MIRLIGPTTTQEQRMAQHDVAAILRQRGETVQAPVEARAVCLMPYWADDPICYAEAKAAFEAGLMVYIWDGELKTMPKSSQKGQ